MLGSVTPSPLARSWSPGDITSASAHSSGGAVGVHAPPKPPVLRGGRLEIALGILLGAHLSQCRVSNREADPPECKSRDMVIAVRTIGMSPAYLSRGAA